jgi:hypothetical protein
MPRTIATFDALLTEVHHALKRPPSGFGAAMAHCAQSIECSIDGYPRPAAWLIRVLVGPWVLKRFLKKGFMRHDTNAPVPGVPPPEGGLSAEAGVARLESAIRRFVAHSGALAPHFAYGPVSKQNYEAIHAMHTANHLDALLG